MDISKDGFQTKYGNILIHPGQSHSGKSVNNGAAYHAYFVELNHWTDLVAMGPYFTFWHPKNLAVFSFLPDDLSLAVWEQVQVV